MKDCIICGGTKYLIPSGEPCPKCNKNGNADVSFDDSCNIVPMDYRGVKFSKEMLPNDLGEAYKNDLNKIYNSIVKNSRMLRNYFIGSPISHGKKVLCYSAIQHLFFKGDIVFPIVDLGELRRIMTDLDYGKIPELCESLGVNAEDIYKCKYMFIKIPDSVGFSDIDTLLKILDRRTRRSLSTIFIYNNSWDILMLSDKYDRLASLKLDGTMGTLAVKSYWKEKEGKGEEDIGDK